MARKRRDIRGDGNYKGVRGDIGSAEYNDIGGRQMKRWETRNNWAYMSYSQWPHYRKRRMMHLRNYTSSAAAVGRGRAEGHGRASIRDVRQTTRSCPHRK